MSSEGASKKGVTNRVLDRAVGKLERHAFRHDLEAVLSNKVECHNICACLVVDETRVLSSVNDDLRVILRWECQLCSLTQSSREGGSQSWRKRCVV